MSRKEEMEFVKWVTTYVSEIDCFMVHEAEIFPLVNSMRDGREAMTESVLTASELSPDNPELLAAARTALETQIPARDVQEYLEKLGGVAVPSPIGATVTIKLAVWGNIQVNPDGQPWTYDNTVWGGPGYFGTSAGFLYTAYDSWDAFFRNVTSCHVQGIASGPGILQVNWFISNGTPVGQFNGAAGGIGLVEAGGSGKWKHK